MPITSLHCLSRSHWEVRDLGELWLVVLCGSARVCFVCFSVCTDSFSVCSLCVFQCVTGLPVFSVDCLFFRYVCFSVCDRFTGFSVDCLFFRYVCFLLFVAWVASSGREGR